MNKSKISFYFIFIAFFTLLSIFITIVQVSYSNLTNPIKQIEADKYLEPLDPVLDSEIIQEIEKRQALDENGTIIINSLNPNNNENTNNISPEASATPTLNVTIQPTPTTEEKI